MPVTVFVIGTVVMNALALVMLVRGLRAKARPGCTSRAAWCALFGILQGGVAVACYAGALVTSFSGVANVDPSEKATVLSRGISAAMQIVSWGVLATFPPFIYACVLFVRRYRLPPEDAAQPPP